MSDCMVVKLELDENGDDKRMSSAQRISLVEEKSVSFEISLMFKIELYYRQLKTQYIYIVNNNF